MLVVLCYCAILKARDGGAVPRQAHNLKAPVQFRLPQQVFEENFAKYKLGTPTQKVWGLTSYSILKVIS